MHARAWLHTSPCRSQGSGPHRELERLAASGTCLTNPVSGPRSCSCLRANQHPPAAHPCQWRPTGNAHAHGPGSRTRTSTSTDYSSTWTSLRSTATNRQSTVYVCTVNVLHCTCLYNLRSLTTVDTVRSTYYVGTTVSSSVHVETTKKRHQPSAPCRLDHPVCSFVQWEIKLGSRTGTLSW
jgi:hypothetical protein